jgi:hypothetical protein
MSIRRFAATLSLSVVALAGCAETVPDVDRTQGNLLRRADLEGEWYLLQTVTHVPSTTGYLFEGETSRLERIRFRFEENALVAYRSYALIPGAENPSNGARFDGTESPVAAWPVLGYVDVEREYNSSTGEQSNVISENTSDRLWFERDFVRVDWSQSQVSNFDFIAPARSVTAMASFTPEEQGGAAALYREVDEGGATRYFDVLGRFLVEPDEEACWLTWAGWGAYDCAAAEIEVRTSVSRAPTKPDYEPFQYDDQLMSRFGYFRSERYTYDEQRGITDAGREYLINRHNIWRQTHDADGRVLPVSVREVRTVPYYLGPNFPSDPLLDTAAQATMAQWDAAGRRAVAAAWGKPVTEVTTPVFVLCHTPVVETDDDACGAVGFAPRMGDLRYSTLHWVDTDTVEGLLGYGPSAADPITGEIISGKAYVYGAAVSTWAQYATDVLRFFNGELDTSTLIFGEHYARDVEARLTGKETAAPRAPALSRVPVDRPVARSPRARPPARPTPKRAELRPYDAHATHARIQAAREAGHSPPMLLNDEVKRALARRAGLDWETADETTREALDPTRVLSPEAMRQLKALRAKMRARSADMADMLEPNIEGLVRKYAGRTDYDAVWRELRAEIFASTAEHEVGHTLGLRHNFQGSYDSLNYPDDYWSLREETLEPIESLGDLYDQASLTEAQRDGLMRQKQYSSIMDYGFSWANDLNGLGKYDSAAILFGYSSGTYAVDGPVCERHPSVPHEDGCLAKLPGHVEVFKHRRSDLGEAGAILTRREGAHAYDDSGLPSITALERFHYTTVAQAFPTLDDLSEAGRETMSYADYLLEKEADTADRAVKVPYLFCSDEWEGGLLSCRVFDQGADPFEMTRSLIDEYRSYYPFVNFRRGRVMFDVIDPLFTYYGSVFLPLSDVFQSWYLAPYGFDPAFDRSYDLAINSGFDLLAEVLTTPEYGTWCEGANGRLIHLSDAVIGQAEPVVDDADCAPDGRRWTIEAGEGRRQFSRYDANAGYYFEWKPLEAGHYWTTLAALWALVDPEAYAIGVEGDAGVFAISYYDWFGDEIDRLLGGMLASDYRGFAPRAVEADDADPTSNVRPTRVVYGSSAPIYDFDSDAYFDPETGAPLGAELPDTAGSASVCEACVTDSDCAGFTNELGGVYCQPYAGSRVCVIDCTEGPGSCPSGTTCYNGNCLPDGTRTCEDYVGECDAAHPLGRCPVGQTCEAGTCVEGGFAPLLEAEPTFSLTSDVLWYGFVYTTASYSTRFNDQMNVFRLGSPNQVVGDPAVSETVTFTDPLRGITWAAVQPRCDLTAPPDGSVPLCGSCIVDAQCGGHTGRADGTLCAALDGPGNPGTCLQRCTGGQAECPQGTVCGDDLLCQPAGGCAAPAMRCAYLEPADTAAVKMVRRGRALSEEYEAAMDAWFGYSGPDAALDDRLARAYYRAQYALTSHLDMLDTISATYAIFGRVY